MASSSLSSYHTPLSAASPEDRCFTDMQGFWKIYGTALFLSDSDSFCGENSTNKSSSRVGTTIVRSIGYDIFPRHTAQSKVANTKYGVLISKCTLSREWACLGQRWVLWAIFSHEHAIDNQRATGWRSLLRCVCIDDLTTGYKRQFPSWVDSDCDVRKTLRVIHILVASSRMYYISTTPSRQR